MPECKEACPQLDKLEREVQQFREQNSETHKEIFKRLNELERTNAVQDERYRATMDKLDEISEKQDSLGEKLGVIEAKPAKRWDKLVETVLVAAVTAVVAYLLGRGGL